MKEWSKKNELNSFNSMKGLLYSNWYQAIRDWKDRKIKAPLPPVEVSLDPIQACQLRCSHCNASRYLENPPKDKMTRIPDDHLMNLIRFLGVWGVKAICFGGGGEPTLHTKLREALELTTEVGMQSSVATNGIAISDELSVAMARNCRWVGISVDSAKAETYEIGRKKNCFNDTITNMKRLVENTKRFNTNCDVAFKFLIFEYNQHEIYDACKLAKEIGVHDFHARPADLSHQGMDEKYKGKAKQYDINIIKEQFEKCRELEDDDFNVYTIVHKFDENFIPRKDFSQCYASPCCLQICPDGNCYLCPDQRYQEFYKLGSHYPNPTEIIRFWGNTNHRNLVFKTGKKNCDTRCTFNTYCKQVEELFISDKDPMCKNFI